MNLRFESITSELFMIVITKTLENLSESLNSELKDYRNRSPGTKSRLMCLTLLEHTKKSIEEMLRVVDSAINSIVQEDEVVVKKENDVSVQKEENLF